MDALEALNAYYTSHDEDGRLLSPHGRVEYLTTMRYIEKYLRPGMRILEIGAGTGRYSHALARMGYAVDAVELIEHNIEIFKKNTLPDENVTVRQGNALDLSAFANDTYDITLLLGPMYHLFEEAEKPAALKEALRVTKPGGKVYVAYCMSDPSVMSYGFLRGNAPALIEKGLLDPVTFAASSTPEEVFVLYRVEDINGLIAPLPAKRLHLAGTDLYTNYFRDQIDQMPEDLFQLYLQYHFSICERADMLGVSHHTLDVLEKTNTI